MHPRGRPLQAALRRGIILLGPATAEQPLSLHRAARRLDRRLLDTTRSVVALLELTQPRPDCAPLRHALDRLATWGIDIATIVPCFYPFSRQVRESVEQALAIWQAERSGDMACCLAGSFDDLLDLDFLIDLSLQIRPKAPPVALKADLTKGNSPPSCLS
jgi:hypothetical protein